MPRLPLRDHRISAQAGAVQERVHMAVRLPLRLVLLLTMLPGLSPMSAQQVAIGFRAGHSISSLVNPSLGKQGTREDFVGGLSGTLILTPWLAVQAEVLRTVRGMRGLDSFDLRMEYLEAPLLVRLTPARHGRLSALVVFGVAPAGELSCGGHARDLGAGLGASPARPIDCLGYRTSKGDFGLVAGTAMQVQAGRLAGTAEFRYTHGVRNLSAAYPAGGSYSRTLGFLIGAHWHPN